MLFLGDAKLDNSLELKGPKLLEILIFDFLKKKIIVTHINVISASMCVTIYVFLKNRQHVYCL